MSAASRVVSLLPSATEILFAIGAGDRVVGVTHECDHPDAAGGLPKVTASLLPTQGIAPGDIDRHIHAARHAGSSIYRLDEAELARLEPDLIITQELCDVCAVAYTEVRRAVRRLAGEVPVLSLEPRSMEEICLSIEEVGAATGCADGAARTAGAMRQRIAEIGAVPRMEPRPRVVCIEWTDPLMVGGHWVPEMVRIAGGVDVLGVEGAPSRYVSWDEVIDAQPEVMILMPCGYDLARTLELVPEVTSRPGFDDLPCARAGRVMAVDGSAYFSRPGPRVVHGLEILLAAISAEAAGPAPFGAAYWNQPATSRIALISPTLL
jgi:iron complex transport system substrate-binding protein